MPLLLGADKRGHGGSAEDGSTSSAAAQDLAEPTVRPCRRVQAAGKSQELQPPQPVCTRHAAQVSILGKLVRSGDKLPSVYLI